MSNYIYILECKDKSLYTGWTNDLDARLRAHNLGTGAKYTRGRTPCTIVYYEEFETKSEALKREAEIKKLPRSSKLLLKKENHSEAT